MTSRHAVTLVEVLIVVIILGVLACVVVPQFSQAADDNRAQATAALIRGLERKISVEFARTGAYPAAIEAAWFAGGHLPINPYCPEIRSDRGVLFQVVSGDELHPADKTDVASGAFWYNNRNGLVRARVARGANEAITLWIYNAANSTNIVSIDQQD